MPAHANPALARPQPPVAINRRRWGAMSKAASRFAFVSSDTADAKAALE
ncbi:MAG: NAD kinase, partial [Mesorhizobium sp.]